MNDRPYIPGRTPEEDKRFNAQSSWYSMTLRQRFRLCKLAGFAHPFDVADKRFADLTDGELQVLACAVRDNFSAVPDCAWGLAHELIR